MLPTRLDWFEIKKSLIRNQYKMPLLIPCKTGALWIPEPRVSACPGAQINTQTHTHWWFEVILIQTDVLYEFKNIEQK